LLIIGAHRGKGLFYPISGRDMTLPERSLYQRRHRR
jgi:hypothetical protein